MDWSVYENKIRHIRTQVAKCLIIKEQHIQFNTLLNREPLQLLEHRGHVINRISSGNDSNSRVLD